MKRYLSILLTVLLVASCAAGCVRRKKDTAGSGDISAISDIAANAGITGGTDDGEKTEDVTGSTDDGEKTDDVTGSTGDGEKTEDITGSTDDGEKTDTIADSSDDGGKTDDNADKPAVEEKPDSADKPVVEEKPDSANDRTDTADTTDSIVGKYMLKSVNGQTVEEYFKAQMGEEAEAYLGLFNLSAFGDLMTLELKPDGTVVFTEFLEDGESGTWQRSESGVLITMGGETHEFPIENGEITFDTGSEVFVFHLSDGVSIPSGGTGEGPGDDISVSDSVAGKYTLQSVNGQSIADYYKAMLGEEAAAFLSILDLDAFEELMSIVLRPDGTAVLMESLGLGNSGTWQEGEGAVLITIEGDTQAIPWKNGELTFDTEQGVFVFRKTADIDDTTGADTGRTDGVDVPSDDIVGLYLLKTYDGQPVEEYFRSQLGDEAAEYLAQFNISSFAELMTVELKSDGTAVITELTEVIGVGTWTPGGSGVVITVEGDSMEFPLENGELTLENSVGVFVYQKSSGVSGQTGGADVSSDSAAGRYVLKSVDGQPIDDYFKAELGDEAADYLSMLGISSFEELMTIELKTDGTAAVWSEGETGEGTWEQRGERVIITIEDEPEEFILRGGELIHDSGDEVLAFQKSDGVSVSPDDGADRSDSIAGKYVLSDESARATLMASAEIQELLETQGISLDTLLTMTGMSSPSELMTIVLNDDGTMVLSAFGQEDSNGTWTRDGNTLIMTRDDGEAESELEVVDSKLVMYENGLEYVFVKSNEQ